MAAMTLLCDLGAPAVTALMLSKEATISPSSHLFVSPPGEGTHEIPQPSLGHSTHTLTATHTHTHTVSSTLRLRQNPGMPSSKCGHCNRTGRTSRGVRQVAGEDTCSHRGVGEAAQPAAKWPIWPMRAMSDPYLPGRTSDHQDWVPPRSWRHAGESREQDTESIRTEQGW